MRRRRTRDPGRCPLLTGFATGCAIGGLLLAMGTVAAAVDAQPSPGAGMTGLRDVLHTPPHVAGENEAVALDYDVVCQADDQGRPCPARGTVFVRPFTASVWTRIPLIPGDDSVLRAKLDRSLTAGDGFSYYAAIEDGLGSVRTVPDGGAASPHRVWVAKDVRTIDLAQHRFGDVRPPDRTSLSAAWGSARGELGLLTGRELARIGPSSFDVARDGTVVVLDQVNDRLARYPASGGTARYVPIAFDGGEGDLAVAADGAMHVLDQSVEPVVRSYTPGGALVGAVSIEDRAADMVRASSSGIVVHGYPGDRWFPVRRSGASLRPVEQAAGARSGLAVSGGSEVVVHGGMHEATFALVDGSRIRRAWRVTSSTNLGEIQLAEPLGDGLLVVVRTWTDADAEYLVLSLTPTGVARSFAVAAVEWAESAALGRFRLLGETLYQLRSSPAGAEVVTFDLGGAR